MKCSFYRNVWDKYGTVVHVHKILEAIQNGKYKTVIERLREETDDDVRANIKKGLPGASFSGTFSKRYDNMIQSYTGLVQVDVDEKKAAPAVLKGLKYDNYVYFYFRSPSGGVKAFYKTEKDMKYHKEYSFPAIRDYFESRYGVRVDEKCKNLSRLCFVSYDPDLHVNENCDIMDIRIKKRVVLPKDYSGEVTEDAREVFNTAYGWLIDKGQYFVPDMSGNRNDIIHKLACILNRAGLDEDLAISTMIAQLGVIPEMYEEAEYTIRSAYRRNRHEHGSKPIRVNKTKKRRNKLF